MIACPPCLSGGLDHYWRQDGGIWACLKCLALMPEAKASNSLRGNYGKRGEATPPRQAPDLEPARVVAAAISHGRRRPGKTGYWGVIRTPQGRYHAKIVRKGKPIHLGAFATAEEAARAYDDAVAKYGVPTGRLNKV